MKSWIFPHNLWLRSEIVNKKSQNYVKYRVNEFLKECFAKYPYHHHHELLIETVCCTGYVLNCR